MPKRMKVERSPNYSYYSDILWCSIPLVGMSWYFYGLRPVLLFLAALLTAYLCDCALAPLHGTGYQSHEPSSECFAALIVLMMPASISYPIVIAAVIVAVLVKEAFGGEGHYPFHPAAVGMVVAAATGTVLVVLMVVMARAIGIVAFIVVATCAFAVVAIVVARALVVVAVMVMLMVMVAVTVGFVRFLHAVFQCINPTRRIKDAIERKAIGIQDLVQRNIALNSLDDGCVLLQATNKHF